MNGTTVDIISSDPQEPIIIVKGSNIDVALSMMKNINTEDPSFNQENHMLVIDNSFSPTVYKKCGDIDVENNSKIKDSCDQAICIAARFCHSYGNEELGKVLNESIGRKYWKGPSIIVYGDGGGMSVHNDRGEVDSETGLPTRDGFLVTTNLGLTCHFNFETRKGHKSTISVPSGSILIFDEILTKHAIHSIIPDSCPKYLIKKYPSLSRNRLSIICRQSLKKI